MFGYGIKSLGKLNRRIHMNKNTEWEKRLSQALSRVQTPYQSPFDSEARRRAVRRVIQGGKFLKREGHAFIARTRKHGFCALDIQNDVLSETGPNWGAATRSALTRKQRADYGFDPAVPYFFKEWNELYTTLWKKAGTFFQKHRQYGVR